MARPNLVSNYPIVAIIIIIMVVASMDRIAEAGRGVPESDTPNPPNFGFPELNPPAPVLPFLPPWTHRPKSEAPLYHVLPILPPWTHRPKLKAPRNRPNFGFPHELGPSPAPVETDHLTTDESRLPLPPLKEIREPEIRPEPRRPRVPAGDFGEIRVPSIN